MFTDRISLAPSTRRLSLTLPLAAFALAATLSTEAHARGLVVVNTGEDVMKIHDIPSETLNALEIPSGAAVGVMYSRFGVFWLDIARWDPKYVLFMDDGIDGFSYEEVPVEDLALLADVEVAQIAKPTRYYLPPGGVLIGLLVVVGLPYSIYTKRREDDRRTTLMADTRYASAVSDYNSNFEEDEGVRLDKAVASLSEQGVPIPEARENMMFLLGLEDVA